MSKIDELKSLLSEGNPLGGLPLGLDNKLQDAAQIVGGISYTDIHAFSKVATKQDYDTLRRMYKGATEDNVEEKHERAVEFVKEVLKRK